MFDSALNLDLLRLDRQGFPEVVFARGKTRAQTINALRRLQDAHGHALATGVSEDLDVGGVYDPVSKLYRLGQMPIRPGWPCVVSAGTSDQFIAEEAAQTLEFLATKPSASMTSASLACIVCWTEWTTSRLPT